MAQLSRDERLYLIGCLRNADDEGRLIGHPAYLKSEIFRYDEDIDLARMEEIKAATIEKMRTWRPENVWLLKDYKNGNHDYLYFPNFYQFNKPSHPTSSKLPTPPSGEAPEPLPSPSGEVTREPQENVESASAVGQSSQGKVKLDKDRVVQEDFSKYFDNKSDLTDFLRKTLTSYMSSGLAAARQAPGGVTPEREAATAAQWGIPVLEKFWEQAVGTKLSGVIWQGAYKALQEYPVEVVASAFVKASRYKGGKHKSWKYFETIINEEMEKRK